MFNYHDIHYATDWHQASFDAFLADRKTPRRVDRSEQVRQKGYRHTTCHGRVQLDPAVFMSGCGCVLTDVDGNHFLDFGSGIYVANLGHAHPKVSEAVARQARTLMNCHDYLTPVKAAYVERLADTVRHRFNTIHLYDNGATAVEFGIRAMRAITGKYEIISCFSDHHGKTEGAAALGRLSPLHGPHRPPGFYLVPRPDPYRPIFKKQDGTIDTDAYINFYDLFIKESTTGQVAGFILEPVQGWGGTIIPPADFFPKLIDFCQSRDMLLMTDEILTGSGRTGKWLCTDYWGISPDITVLGKGLGNGFPMSGLLVQKKHERVMANIGPSTTFGGNPMACAAGLSTLEVIESENILQKSEQNGEYMLSQLNALKQNHPSIGDVRGCGSLLGVEFVEDRHSKKPLSDMGARVYVEAMKRKFIPGIPVKHLLRIAPPLIADEYIMDTAMALLDESITAAEKSLNI